MAWYCFYVKEEWPLDYLENYSGTPYVPYKKRFDLQSVITE